MNLPPCRQSLVQKNKRVTILFIAFNVYTNFVYKTKRLKEGKIICTQNSHIRQRDSRREREAFDAILFGRRRL